MNSPDPEILYRALIGDPARLRHVRRLQFRCPERCLLLDAIAVADTILMHQKRFKQSDEVNQRRSNSAGRAKNTYDGASHWKPRTYFIGQSALAYPEDNNSQLAIQCDHVGVLSDGDMVTVTAPEFHNHWNDGHAEVIARPDGSRYTVR